MSAGGEHEVSRDHLRVTSGSIGETPSGDMEVTEPTVRAQLRSGNPKSARLQFQYRGLTKRTRPLASGRVACQIGIKLLAQNTCNVLYVMWQLDGQESIQISVKRNPGQSKHKQCGASGYHPIAGVPVAVTATDQCEHCLQATLTADNGDFRLAVNVDEVEVWRGAVDSKLLAGLEGPAGLRTDNGSFVLKLFIG